MIKLIIFDLDGTLLNTVADLANSTNFALEQCGFPTHETAAYNFFVGNGINKLFERALPEGQKTQENILRVRGFFLPYYEKYNSVYSAPYAGIPEVLNTLHEKGYKLAVASNKYHAGTLQMIEQFFPEIPFTAVLGQREGIPAKPHPQIVKDVLGIAGVSKEETLYVGDSGVDMETVLNSEVTGVGVTWGFRPLEELQQFNPKYIIHKPEEILEIVEKLR